MSVLLIAEHNNKEVRPFTLNAITAASQMNTDVHVLLIGNNCGDVAKSLSEMSAVKNMPLQMISRCFAYDEEQDGKRPIQRKL